MSTLQAQLFSSLDKAELGVWEAVQLLGELPSFDSGFEQQSGLDLRQQAFRTAEACRLAHPSEDWLHLVGLLHPLGHLLAHPR